MMITLRDMRSGDQGRVKGYDATAPAYRRKLLSMGLTPGVEFRVVRVAPLGDPVELRVRGASVSLRKDEASALLVERVS